MSLYLIGILLIRRRGSHLQDTQIRQMNSIDEILYWREFRILLFSTYYQLSEIIATNKKELLGKLRAYQNKLKEGCFTGSVHSEQRIDALVEGESGEKYLEFVLKNKEETPKKRVYLKPIILS